MDYLVQFQINIFSLLILAVLFVFVRLSTIKTYSKFLINMIIITSAIGIIDEPLSWIFDGVVFNGSYYINYLTNLSLYIIGPVTAGLLMSYVDYRVFNDKERISGRLFYQHITMATLGILIINFVHPIYFTVDPVTNVYAHAQFTLMHYMMFFGLYLYMLYFLVVNFKRIITNDLLILVVCFLVPIIAMVGQIFDSRLHLAWTSVVFVLMAIYILLETTPMEEDHLTKLYNRRSYEQHLEYLIQHGHDFAVMVLDLNNFKSINDNYGHKSGDEVLVEFASIVKNVFEEKGLVARLGGDEFSIIIDCEIHQVDLHIRRIQKQLRNHSNPIIQDLTFSYGYELYQKTMTIDDIFITADKRMYQNKVTIKQSDCPLLDINEN